MKMLSEILKGVQPLSMKGDLERPVSSVSLNSKESGSESVFVALVGNATDGHLYIQQAIEKGAKTIVYQNDPSSYAEGITYIKVSNTHEAVGIIACNFYDNPSSKLKLIGVTGTNGKTTTATLLHQLFRNLGHNAGLIGTVANKINDISFETSRTTPDPVTLNELLSEMAAAHCEYCFMEVSSHAVSEKRITGITFAGGIFTNLTLDHLDYHKTFESYRDAKKKFFDTLSSNAFALSNKDDINGEYMLEDSKAKKYFYSLKDTADFTERLETKLIGEFNAYNALAIYATATILEQDKKKVLEEMKSLTPVEGRFDYFKNSKNITGIVDYAHTPDALENVLRTAKAMKGTGRLISVFGCGGDRDTTKRPIMARIGYEMSDIVILTSDNPRTENPSKILEDMHEGIRSLSSEKVHVIEDRHDAIKKACDIAHEGDYILIAGKGHEKYQEINGVKNHFDDMEELKKYLV